MGVLSGCGLEAGVPVEFARNKNSTFCPAEGGRVQSSGASVVHWSVA